MNGGVDSMCVIEGGRLLSGDRTARVDRTDLANDGTSGQHVCHESVQEEQR